jgi:hypothetical protein
MPRLLEISSNQFNADAETDDSSELGRAEGKSPNSLNQTELSLKQFAKWME